jgi:hypothetical protein
VVHGHIHPGTAEATLLEPALAAHRETLPAGAVLLGTATERPDGVGFALTFDQARITGGSLVPVKASAFADAAGARRQPLRPGGLPARLELSVLIESIGQ